MANTDTGITNTDTGIADTKMANTNNAVGCLFVYPVCTLERQGYTG